MYKYYGMINPGERIIAAVLSIFMLGIYSTAASSRVKIRDGKIPERVVVDIYRLAGELIRQDISSASHIRTLRTPKLEIFFLASPLSVVMKEDNRKIRGRTVQGELHYPIKGREDSFTVHSYRVISRRAEPWQVWLDGGDFVLLFSALIHVLDEANHLYLDEEEVRELRREGLKRYRCSQGIGPCDWRGLKTNG